MTVKRDEQGNGDSQRAGPAWYRDGIRFECGQCGNCCTGQSGRVWFGSDELVAMASHLGLLPFEFTERYTRRIEGRPSLTEVERAPGRFDCVFLRFEGKKATCAIHAVKPRQCRTFPFWPEHLLSATRFESAIRHCEGAQAAKSDKTARHYRPHEIEQLARESGEVDTIGSPERE